MLFDTPVVVTSELPEGSHPSLKLLSRKVRKADIEAFIRIADGYHDSGDQQRADAVLEVSTTANEGTYRALYALGFSSVIPLSAGHVPLIPKLSIVFSQKKFH